MKFLGVNIDFNKNYSETELEELEEQLDAAFGRFVRRLLRFMFLLIVLAVLVKFGYQLCHG
jgi:hypothetical protein